jgi:hypothetical protein
METATERRENDSQHKLTIEPANAAVTIDVELAVIPAKQDDPFLVAFEEPFDADNPKSISYPPYSVRSY